MELNNSVTGIQYQSHWCGLKYLDKLILEAANKSGAWRKGQPGEERVRQSSQRDKVRSVCSAHLLIFNRKVGCSKALSVFSSIVDTKQILTKYLVNADFVGEWQAFSWNKTKKWNQSLKVSENLFWVTNLDLLWKIYNDSLVRVPTESILWNLGKVTSEYNNPIKSPIIVILSLPLVL